MRKEGIRVGDVVTFRNGTTGVARDSHWGIEFENSTDITPQLRYYNDDLRRMRRGINDIGEEFDIVKVTRTTEETLYEREATKEVTMKELREHYGCEVKVVE